MKVEVNNINDKIVQQLDVVLKELKQAYDNSFITSSATRQNITKVEGILETIKLIME